MLSYKYLGTIIDSKFNFEVNYKAVCKKGHQRLFCLRKLALFYIDRTMMILFYHAFIESLLTFSLMSWFGNSSVNNNNSLSQIVRWSRKLIGESDLSPASVYTRQLQRMTNSILNDEYHQQMNLNFCHLDIDLYFCIVELSSIKIALCSSYHSVE